MPVWVWIVIAALVLLAAVILGAAVAVGRRKRTERLKERFGPEYERTVSATGEPAAAEKELAARERRHDDLDIRALSPQARQGFDQRWHGVQSAFVDDPSGALGEADRLVTEVMGERGYPVQDFERRAADISVDHPTIVENYRAAHAIQSSQPGDEISTEARRQAFVHYRALFDTLLAPDADTRTDPARRTPTPKETRPWPPTTTITAPMLTELNSTPPARRLPDPRRR